MVKRPHRRYGRERFSPVALNPIVNDSGSASTTISGIVVFLLGIGLTLFVIVNPMQVSLFEKVKQAVMPEQASVSPTTEKAEGKEDREILYWYAPMDPTYIMDKPGKSPMGMDLVPKYADEAGEAAEGAITIDPATVQNIGVLTETVKRGDLRVEIRTVGNLDYNDDKIFWVNTKYDGWIERVHVDYVGQPVKKGEPLFEIYSPDLVSTQEEYLSALKYRDKMAKSGFDDAYRRAEALLESSRKRLEYWDITEEQIRRLEERGRIAKTLTAVSPVTGLVVKKMDEALEGMYAREGMNLYKIADLSSLWVHVDLYEYQLPWIKAGQEARVEISYYPGEVFTGKVLFFYPYVDEKTRTIRVCLEIPNRDGRLRPKMFATVKFSPVAARDSVLVPDIAVLHTGKRNVVILDRGKGRFEPREVTLGLQGQGMYEVREGLEGGEKIVTSSQFLIDSESNLREAINKMLMAKKEKAEPATKDVEKPTGMKEMDHAAHKEKPVVDNAQTVEEVEKALQAYLPIWRALANDSTEGIEENAEKLAAAAKEAARQTHVPTLRERLEKLAEEASKMKTEDLSAARESMKGLSRALLAVFETHEVRLPKAYAVIECPMVKERWVQDTDQVSNPFLGSSMPLCGLKVGEVGGNAGA